jgi:aryl-alcohol dehydrogenase-like predicted oxidoreductase
MQNPREIGSTGIQVSPVALGCWPIAGMTSLDVNHADSLATLQTAFELGINFFDTAYCYGANGESEKLIAEALGSQREQIVIATKGGLHWEQDGNRVFDARPATLHRQCEESLQRLNTDYVDLLYLHAPDGATPLADSAGAMRELLAEGKTRAVGVSNLNLQQLQTFHAVCPVSALQPPYNLLQRQIETDLLPWCQREGISVIPYWPLLKGLLAGKLPRDHQFAAGDGRAKYTMFQGEEWEQNQDFVDRLRHIGEGVGKTVAQIAVNWVLNQAGITSALCGAKRASQITETASAGDWTLPASAAEQLQEALRLRGTPITPGAV